MAGIGRPKNRYAVPMTGGQVLEHTREKIAVRVDERGAKSSIGRAKQEVFKERRLAGASLSDNVYGAQQIVRTDVHYRSR